MANIDPIEDSQLVTNNLALQEPLPKSTKRIVKHTSYRSSFQKKPGRRRPRNFDHAVAKPGRNGSVPFTANAFTESELLLSLPCAQKVAGKRKPSQAPNPRITTVADPGMQLDLAPGALPFAPDENIFFDCIHH